MMSILEYIHGFKEGLQWVFGHMGRKSQSDLRVYLQIINSLHLWVLNVKAFIWHVKDKTTTLGTVLHSQ